MERQEYRADFTTLKSAYLEVKNFIEQEIGWEVKSLFTTIEEDLGCTGDDADELLIKFTDKYNLSHDDFNFQAHFMSEGEWCDITSMLIALFMFPLHIIKWITLGKLNLLPPEGYWERKTLDLTFGDMVAWYLAKDFKHRSEMNIMIAR